MTDQGLRVSTVDTEIEVSGAGSSRGWRIWVYPGIFLAILIGVWQLATVLGWAPVYLLPAPSDVVIRIFESWELIWGHSVTTISEIVSGFLIGTAFGLALALPISYSATVRNTLYPLIVASQAVPKIAVAPLLVLWLGLGIWPKIVITALMVFFPVVVTAAEGFSSVDRNLVELLRSVHAPRTQMFFRISIPHAMPRIFAGLKIAITLAVVGAVVGEWVGADSGLGYLLVYANTFLDSTLLFSALFVLVVVGILLFLAVGVVEHLVTPWTRATNR